MLAKAVSLSNFCHDLNTTMNALHYLVDQLEHSDLDEHQLNMVHTLKSTSKTMAEYIKDLGVQGDQSFNDSIINVNSIDPVELVENVFELFRYQAEMKGLQFRLHIQSDKVHHVLSDELKLTQMLINIISNAIKYTDEGAVDVYVERSIISMDKEKLTIICTDTGIGISSEALPHIFDRGYRDPEIMDHGIEGNGLGLCITKDIVQLLGGDIDVESKRGHGTKIQVEFKLNIVMDDQYPENSFEKEIAQKINGKKILIADDNQINLLLLKSMLDRNGVYVDECVNGFEAIEKVQQDDYDMILLDIQMPELDGAQVMFALKHELKLTVPVVAMTATVMASDHEHLTSLGFVDVISKPVEELTLNHRIGKIFTSIENGETQQQTLVSKIENKLYEMASGDIPRMIDLRQYLKEEVNFAIDGWQKSLLCSDWVNAKKILHREKGMLETLDMDEFDYMIQSLLTHEKNFPMHQLILMYENIMSAFLTINDWLDEENNKALL